LQKLLKGVNMTFTAGVIAVLLCVTATGMMLSIARGAVKESPLD
jgi:hypothetical protein